MNKSFKANKTACFLLLPQMVITIVFFFWPALQALKQSLFQGDAFGLIQRFVGLENFKELLFSSVYHQSILVTVLFSFSVTLLTLMLGLLMAVLVNEIIRGKLAYKALLIWPYAVAPAVAGLLWRFFFNPAVGWGSYLLRKIGIDWNYYVHPAQAMTVVVIASSWQQFSYNFLFFFAGLQAIPRSLLEAASIDGANAWQRFWHVSFPLLAPTTFFLMVINLIYSFFDTLGVIQVVTQGGPARRTATMVYKVYNDGFVGLNFSSSAAQSVVLMVVVATLTTIQFKFIDKKVHY